MYVQHPSDPTAECLCASLMQLSATAPHDSLVVHRQASDPMNGMLYNALDVELCMNPLSEGNAVVPMQATR